MRLGESNVVWIASLFSVILISTYSSYVKITSRSLYLLVLVFAYEMLLEHLGVSIFRPNDSKLI